MDPNGHTDASDKNGVVVFSRMGSTATIHSRPRRVRAGIGDFDPEKGAVGRYRGKSQKVDLSIKARRVSDMGRRSWYQREPLGGGRRDASWGCAFTKRGYRFGCRWPPTFNC